MGGNTGSMIVDSTSTTIYQSAGTRGKKLRVQENDKYWIRNHEMTWKHGCINQGSRKHVIMDHRKAQE